jgi:sugar lactone lactonase YvrE
VDLGSGHVTVTPLENGSGGRAIFTGNAVGVTSSRVLDDVGEVTRRGIQVTLINNTSEPIGANGTFRAVLSDFANLGGLASSYATQTAVSTPSSITRPYGVDVGSDGSVYFSGKTSGQIHKMVNGSTAQLATGFNGPAGVAVVPGTDYLVVAEAAGNVVSLSSLTSGGRAVLAGTGAAGSADGPAASATFSSPDGVTVDSLGNIYVADAGTSDIRMISDPFGTPVVSTLASSGLTTIADIDAFEIQGTEYLAVATKHAVYGVALPGGQVFPIAGKQTTSGNINGAGDVARFKLVRGVDAANGALFVMDAQNYRVKQVTLNPGGNPLDSSSWHVALLAGDGTNAHTDGAGDVAQFQYSQHLCASPSSRLFVASYSGDALRRIESTSSVLPFLGGSGSGGTVPVRLANPEGIYKDDDQERPYIDYSTVSEDLAAGSSKTLDPWLFFIPDDVAAFEFTMALEARTELPEILPANMSPGSSPVGSNDVYARVVAGSLSTAGITDGVGPAATFELSYGLDADAGGTVFIAERVGFCIRMMTPDGEVSTIIGDPTRSGAPTNTSGDLVSLNSPADVAVNAAGNIIYFIDSVSDVVCRAEIINSASPRTDPSNWSVRVIAGTGVSGYVNGDGSVAQFNSLSGIDFGALDDTIYVTEKAYDKVRRLRRTGSDPKDPTHWDVTLLAGASGTTSTSGFVDGTGTSARFDLPEDLCVGLTGDIYVADFRNHAIRVVSPAGVVTTLTGDGTAGFNDDSSGSAAIFNEPNAVEVDDAGYVYVIDFSNASLRRVSPVVGETKTVLGGGLTTPDGLGSETYFSNARGIALLPGGAAMISNANTLVRLERIVDTPAR